MSLAETDILDDILMAECQQCHTKELRPHNTARLGFVDDIPVDWCLLGQRKDGYWQSTTFCSRGCVLLALRSEAEQPRKAP